MALSEVAKRSISKHKSKWMQGVARGIKRRGTKGALRRTLKRMGLLKGDADISQHALSVAMRHARKTGDTKLEHRIELARKFKAAQH